MLCSENKSFVYYRKNNLNFSSLLPVNTRYQNQKHIHHTVHVSSSEYAMNKAALTAAHHKNNSSSPQSYICWNQQSDRHLPSVQKATVPTGYFTSLNGKKSSHTSSRPGTQTPGGSGCDIKHNSYERYLNRLKGNKALKNGIIPPAFALPKIPFNRAFPIYGDKIVKTSIIQGCKQCKPTEVVNNNNTQQVFFDEDNNKSSENITSIFKKKVNQSSSSFFTKEQRLLELKKFNKSKEEFEKIGENLETIPFF